MNLRIALYCLIPGLLAACATDRDVIPLEQSHMNAPVRVLVLESPMSVGPGRLGAVFAPDTKPGSQAVAGPIVRGEAHAREFALVTMDSALGKLSKVELVKSPAQASKPFRDAERKNFESPVTQHEADELAVATGADALLRFRITDYGLTPRSWRKGYITFEVASTLAIAGLVAYSGTTAAKAAAGAYLAQETIEETAEAYAGFGALNVVWRPVRVEAELERLNPAATVWKGSETGLSEAKLSRLVRKVPSAERDSQLDQATSHAVDDLVSDLSVAMGD